MRSALWIAPVIAIIGTASHAQQPARLYEFHGHAHLGHAVAGAGDVDLDGHQDFIAAAWFLKGHVDVRSGVDGAVLFRVDDPEPDGFFGEFVAGGGDVNADGYPDFAASFRGYVEVNIRVYSGRDASLLFKLPIKSTGQNPQGLAFVGDVNQDGHVDLLVGCPRAYVGGYSNGQVLLFSGADGSVLFSDHGDDGEEFGWSVGACGDINEDGIPDFLYTAGCPGRVRAISGRDFIILHERTGQCFSFARGGAAGAGDTNGDGVPDVVVDGTGNGLILSGVDFATLQSMSGMFNSTTGGADLDLDGYDDVAFGDPWDGDPPTHLGKVYAYSGKTGALLWKDTGSVTFGHLGFSCAIIGDANGDGFPDVVAGAPDGLIDDGYARVISGNRSPWAVLGGSRAGSHGDPSLSGTGVPSSGSNVTITLDHMLEHSMFVMAASLLPSSHRLAAGGTLIPTGYAVAWGGTGSGQIVAPFVWPPEPSAMTHWAQVLVLDPAAPGGFSMSNGLSVTTQ